MKTTLTLVIALAAAPLASPAAERGLSEGWAHLVAGRNAEAEAAFASRLGEEGADLRAAIGLAAMAEARSDPDAALGILADALAHADDPRLAPGALSRAASLTYRAADGGAVALPLLSAMARGERGAADPEVRAIAGLAYADVLARLGDFEAALDATTRDSGRLTQWSLIGPFGRFAPLALSRPFPPERGELSTEGLEPGPSRVRPFRIDTVFPQGRVVVPLQYRSLGVVYAASDLVCDEDLSLTLRASSNTSFVLFVDGREALRVDRSEEHAPRAQRLDLELPAGRHRLLAKLVNEGRFVTFELLVEERGTGAPPAGLGNPPVAGATTPGARTRVVPNPLDASAEATRAEDPAALIAAAWWLRGRDLDREAGALLSAARARWPGSSLFLYLMGEHLKNAATGASATEDLSRARGLLEQALDADPGWLRARQLVAEMDQGAGQIDEAWNATSRILEQRPADVEALMLRARMALGEGWLPEAKRLVEDLRIAAPRRIDLVDLEIALFRAMNDLGELDAALARKGALAPADDDWASHLSAAGRVEQALDAWQRMIELRPSYLLGWLGKSQLMADLGRYDEALALLDEAGTLYPDEAWIPFRRAGILALSGDDAAAEAQLERALALDPSRIEIRASLEARRDEEMAEPWLVDVGALIAEQAAPPKGVDSALLADTAVVFIDRFGGQSEVYQGVHAVYTREGVEQEGELQLQPGVRIEGIRVHKADGRRIDVALPPRPPVSLPGLEPGDFIEYVWRRYIPPMAIIPGALDNRSLFLFQGPEREYDFSRYVVIHDAALDVEICGREEGLETTDEMTAGLRVRSWTGRSMPRVALEPFMPNQLEVVPHVRLGFGITWRAVGDLVRAAMAGSLHPDEPLPTLASLVREEAADEHPTELARALHAVVGREIGVGGAALRLGTPASVSASLGEGNRALIALALARELGLEAALVLARPIELLGRELACPTPGLFSYALVEIETGRGQVYLDFNDLNHPFDGMNARFSGSDALRVPLRVDLDPEIVQLPRRQPELLERVDAAVALAPEGFVSGRLGLTTRGTLAAALRKAFREMPIDNQPDAYRSLASRLFPGAEVVDSSIRGLEDAGGPVVIELVFERGLLGRRTPRGIAIPAVAGPLPLASEFAQRPQRRYPLLLDLSEHRIDRLEIELPEGLELAFAPRELSLSGAFGDYALETALEDGRLVIERRAKIPPRRVEPEEYPAFRDFARAIEEVETQELLLQVASPSLR